MIPVGQFVSAVRELMLLGVAYGVVWGVLLSLLVWFVRDLFTKEDKEEVEVCCTERKPFVDINPYYKERAAK